MKYGKERRLGGRVSLFRVVEEVFSLVRHFYVVCMLYVCFFHLKCEVLKEM